MFPNIRRFLKNLFALDVDMFAVMLNMCVVAAYQRFPNFFDHGPVRDFKIFRDPPYEKNIYLQNKFWIFLDIPFDSATKN